jgi:integrase
MNLTVKRVAKLLRNGQPGRHRDGDVKGLYLCVGGEKNANWQLRYQLNNRQHWMGLGSAFDFDLSQARERAREYRRKLADKTDPLLLRRAEHSAKAAAAATTKTFRECADGYLRDHSGKWKNARHGLQWLTSLQAYVFPKLAAIDVAAIARPHVLDVLRQRVDASRGNPAGEFWQVRPVTADRVRNRIELILTWAEAQGYRSGENPARSDLIKHVLPQPTAKAVQHFAAVPYGEMPALVAALRRDDSVAARALQFLILTATRSNEVRDAVWSEIDLAQKVWTVPAKRMKSGKLQNAYREDGNDYVFIGSRTPRLSTAALDKALKRQRSETVHGLRSSFTDWAHEQTSQPNIVIDMALAHSVGTAVEKAYRRTDLFAKRARLMSDWAKYCMSPPKATNENVVPMRAGQ